MWLIISLALTILPHPFFVSVTEIEYVPKDRVMGVSCKLFNDDLETTLRQSTGQQVDIFKGDKKLNTGFLQQYFGKHFSITADGKPLSCKVIGYELDGEACFVYLEAPLDKRPLAVTVQTDLLYDFNRSQINMVHYLDQGNRQSHKLVYPNRDIRFTVN